MNDTSNLTDQELRDKLLLLDYTPPPVNASTRKILEKKLVSLMQGNSQLSQVEAESADDEEEESSVTTPRSRFSQETQKYSPDSKLRKEGSSLEAETGSSYSSLVTIVIILVVVLAAIFFLQIYNLSHNGKPLIESTPGDPKDMLNDFD